MITPGLLVTITGLYKTMSDRYGPPEICLVIAYAKESKATWWLGVDIFGKSHYKSKSYHMMYIPHYPIQQDSEDVVIFRASDCSTVRVSPKLLSIVK